MANFDPRKMLHDFAAEVWEADPESQHGIRGLLVAVARGLWVIGRDMAQGQISLRAMSLVYTTLLSLVPLLAISFSVLKGFGVHEQLEVALLEFLAPLGERGTEIAARIIEFVNNVKVGVLGSVGLALLIYTVISLMQKIERALNEIWHVRQDRPFAQRFSGYLSVIVIGPVLIFSSVGITATLLNAEVTRAIASIEPFGSLLRLAGALVPYLLVVGAFTFIYVFMPNTRVRTGSAIIGALVSGLLWNLVGWGFAKFVVTSAQYTAVYSAFAALIVFMLWLYLAWLILLIGASVAFYHQHPEFLSRSGDTLRLSPRMAETAALAIAAGIVVAFREGLPAPTTDRLSRGLRVPPQLADQLIRAMSNAGIVVAVAAPEGGWVPARPPESIPVTDLFQAVRSDGESARFNPDRVRMVDCARELADRLDHARAEALDGATLADLAASEPAVPLAAK